MLHINLETCSSTQSYLKELIQQDSTKKDQDIIVTCANQTNGKGRGENSWHSLNGAITMSCLLSSGESVTTIPLKVGLFISDFFKEKFNKDIFLKWPNDLMTKDHKKVGGIICHLIDNKIVVGIGINLIEDPSFTKQSFKWDTLKIGPNLIKQDQLSLNLYEFLLKNQSKTFGPQEWNERCIHLNKQVEIKDEFSSTKGVFKGVSEKGEAIIQEKSKTTNLISGSLFIG